MRHYVGNTVAGGANSAEYRIVRPDGEIRWLFDRSRVITGNSGRKLRVDGIASDITQFKQQQEQLYRAANHDALTGLPNRSLMQERLQRALARHERGGESLAILFIDVDRFKTINDSLGHKVGDMVLCEAAKRSSSRCASTTPWRASAATNCRHPAPPPTTAAWPGGAEIIQPSRRPSDGRKPIHAPPASASRCSRATATASRPC